MQSSISKVQKVQNDVGSIYVMMAPLKNLIINFHNPFSRNLLSSVKLSVKFGWLKSYIFGHFVISYILSDITCTLLLIMATRIASHKMAKQTHLNSAANNISKHQYFCNSIYFFDFKLFFINLFEFESFPS